MFLRVPFADDGERLGGEIAPVVEFGFDENTMIFSYAVDVLPGSGRVE